MRYEMYWNSSFLIVTMFQCWLDIVMTTSSSTTLSSSLLCESFSFMLLVLSFLSGCAGNDHTSTPQWRCKSFRLCQYTHIRASKLYRVPPPLPVSPVKTGFTLEMMDGFWSGAVDLGPCRDSGMVVKVRSLDNLHIGLWHKSPFISLTCYPAACQLCIDQSACIVISSGFPPPRLHHMQVHPFIIKDIKRGYLKTLWKKHRLLSTRG